MKPELTQLVLVMIAVTIAFGAGATIGMVFGIAVGLML